MPTKKYKKSNKFEFADIKIKDAETLSLYMDDQKKIMSRYFTGLPIKYQRQVAKAIKRARLLGFLPFVTEANY